MEDETITRVAVVGSRDYPKLSRVTDLVSHLNPKTHALVSGGARGVDSAAEEAAKRIGMHVTVFPADWDKLGKRAGFVRNVKIVANADVVIAFWDGVSPGTRHSIELAHQSGKPVLVVLP